MQKINPGDEDEEENDQPDRSAEIDLDDFYRKEEEFQKKWTGVIILGPTVPAVLACINVVFGSFVVNRDHGSCGYALTDFINGAIAVSFFFLIVFSWVFLGYTWEITVPLIGGKYAIAKPFGSLRYLARVYSVLAGMAFLVLLVGTAYVALGYFCAVTSPIAYSFSLYLVLIYWIGGGMVAAHVFKMIFGAAIAQKLKEATRETSSEELEARVFTTKFREFDKTGEGAVTVDVIPELLKEVGFYFESKDVPALTKTLDPSGTGRVGYEVLFAWFQGEQKKMKEAGGADGDEDDDDEEDDDDA